MPCGQQPLREDLEHQTMGFIFIMTADKTTRFDRGLMLSIYMSRANYANQWSLLIPFIMVQQGEVPFVKLDYSPE